MDLTTLLASAIHDVKNQLHMLAPELNDLARSDDPSTRAAAQNISHRVGAVDRSLVRLLVLYRFSAESGSVQVNISEIYVFDLLNSLLDIDISRGSIYGELSEISDDVQKAKKQITCEVRCDQQLTGYFDENLVSAVLRDAMDNARRFAKYKIVISAIRAEGGTLIVIEDDGVGPGSSQQESQFEAGSTGLGLYLAQCVAEAHSTNGCSGNAQLQKSAGLGGGAFRLFLP